jgi:hypothetical protein
MLDDDACPVLPVVLRRCEDCYAALAAIAFPPSEEALTALPDLYAQLGVPIFAFMNKDDTLHRARVVVVTDTTEECFVTPKEFRELAGRYLARHVCASWN